MPAKPVTHNKTKWIMKRYTWIWIMLVALLSGCEDDFDQGGLNPGEGVTEGMITFHISTEEAPVIATRAGETEQQQESLENVFVIVFDKDGKPVNKAFQQLTVDNHSVNIYLTAVPDQTIYAICNLPEGVADDINEVNFLDELKAQYTEIKSPEGAYSGKHIMSGSAPLGLTVTGQLQKEYTVRVKRLTAQVNFNIVFDPTRETDKFAVGEIFLHNIPMGSMLLDGGGSATEENSWGYHHTDAALLDSLDICPGDYSYVKATDKDNRVDQFFKDKKRLDFEIVKGPVGTQDSYSASFQMFENRQGRVYDDVGNWKNLAGLVDFEKEEAQKLGYEDMYRFYQQINKRGLAGTSKSTADKNKIFKRNEGVNTDKYTVNTTEQGFKYATYLTIRGVYTKRNLVGGEDPIDVTYHVYLGSDNYKDFNVCRNHVYNYQIRIFDEVTTDTRVDAKPIGGLTIYGNFDDVLDAHPNVTQVLVYSPSKWTVQVTDPDATPWLEVSASPVYKPRKVGANPSPDRAAFRLEGDAGLHYFYIHTDEYIPKLLSPHENRDEDINTPRIGKLLFSNQAGKGEVKEVKQYAAQMVIRKRFAVDKAHEVADTFYVERILEKKNMQWGFQHYWSFKMDSLLDDDIHSAKNGLTNTRTLYDTALNGDKWGVEPAYPDGIPANIALGYALAKNRDRNGNGKIDYNEIMWYLPAYTEVQAIVGHIGGTEILPPVYYDKTYDKTVSVGWTSEPCTFFSSTPSGSDVAGITPGFCWAVQYSPNPKKNGKMKVEMRSRFYNVICARRYNGWQGPNTGETGGETDKDEDWNEDEEEIMGKH